MTQLALARKWRPRDFSALVGQDHVVRALTHALTTGRLHHAYLFTGTRGVGKTTISRILAKALNCETGVTATPCQTCQACREIDADRFPDYVEMDAASNRGVDEMAALLEQAAYAPVAGRYKVYMIDEVHMLTGHAFNAMLKTLEEPPEHVKFVLATTDPQKIPVTVLSRCLQFNLRALSAAQIAHRCETILTAEGVTFEPAALLLIGQAARGSMRDALSLLDQAIAYGAGEVSEGGVSEMLGLVSERLLIELLTALADEAAEAYLAAMAKLSAASVAVDAVLASLAQLLHRIARRQWGGAPFDDPRLEQLAARWHPEFLQLAYQIVVQGRRDLPLAPDEITGLEMALLRLFAFAPQREVQPPLLPPNPQPQPQALLPPSGSDEPQQRGSDNRPKPTAAVPSESLTAPLDEANAIWLAAFTQMALSGPARELASHTAVVADDGTVWQLGVDRPAHHWLRTAPELVTRIEEAYHAVAPQGWVRKLRFEPLAQPLDTPARRREAALAARKQQVLDALSHHPSVRLLCDRFDLAPDPESVSWEEGAISL
ncbi:hypothetical protein JCM16106_04480 [Hydrogenophilus islandicus]